MGAHRPGECVFERRGIEALEHEAGGRVVADRFRRGIDDRVDEPAGGTDHGYGAVPLRVELRQAARLEEAGHERDVGGRLHEVGKPLIEADREVDRARKHQGGLLQKLLVLTAAGAQDHKVRPARRCHPAEHFEQEFDPLLLDQPADEGDQRPGVGRCMTKPRRECRASRVLARLDIGFPVGPGEVRIGHRIPNAGVDAVDDAREHAAPRRQEPLESAATG